MPPPKVPRMTQNQKPMARYRPGKVEAQSESEEEDSSDEEDGAIAAQPKRPAATTFRPVRSAGVVLSRGDQKIKNIPKPTPQLPDLDGFETASSSGDDAKPRGKESDSGEDEEGSGTDEEEDADDSDEEDSDSSEDEPQRPLARPIFMSKAKRMEVQSALNGPAVDQREVEEERKRKEKADELLQAQLEREAAARAAGRKAWDDDADIEPEDQVDDRDGIDPEAEHAAWKLRELKRVKRDRTAIEAQEKEREEIERRRNLTQEERDAEDKAYIAAQEDDRQAKGKMAFMQRYHHKGAFFKDDDAELDEEVKAALNRDFAGVKFEDETGDKSVLPEYMRIRDMTRLGKKGRTRYKDLKSEDTGQWGDSGRKREHHDHLDERFRPDSIRDGGQEMTGANNAPMGERRRRDGDDSSDRYEKRPRYD